LSIWQAARAREAERQAVEARERAEQEKDRAEAGFRLARDTVDRFFTQVADSPKMKTQGMEKFRKELLQNAKDFYERLIKELRDEPGARHDLGLAYLRLTWIQETIGDYAAALAASEKGIKIFEELAQAHPAEAKYKQDRNIGYKMLAMVYNRMDDLEKASSAAEEAKASQEKLVTDKSGDDERERELGDILLYLGIIYQNAGRWDDARTVQERALDIQMRMDKNHPGQTRFLAGLAAIQGGLGYTYAALGWADKAEALLRDAEASNRALIQLCPDEPMYRRWLGTILWAVGELYRDQLNSAEKAENTHQEMLKLVDQLAREHPDVAQFKWDLGMAYLALGLDAHRRGRTDDALAKYEQATETLKLARFQGYVQSQKDVLTAQILTAAVRSDRGAYRQAVDDVTTLARPGDLSGDNLYYVACVCSRSVAAAGKDTALSSADRARLQTQYADRAMEFLRQAVVKGERNVARWKNEPGLDSVRSREDFQKLVQELEQKAKK
jgi:serine/threonine-protein kinase